MNTNKPAKTLRDGAIKAVIWRNTTENGAFFSVQIVRSFKDGDAWKETHAFSHGDVLRAAHLLTQAYDAIGALRAKDASAANDEGLDAEVTL